MSLIDIRAFAAKNKKILSGVSLVLAIVLVFWLVNNPAIVGASATKRQLPVYCVQRDDKVVSITFDAAWGNEDTQELIDILNKYNINATFFVVGQWVDKYPESVKALHDAGNEVMSHSDDHAHFVRRAGSPVAPAPVVPRQKPPDPPGMVACQCGICFPPEAVGAEIFAHSCHPFPSVGTESYSRLVYHVPRQK